MKIAIMQPYFFPYIGYFQLLNVVDKFIIYDDVNFINKGWINRNHILIDGAPSMFTIPLKEASQNKLIREIDASEDDKWKKKLLKSLEQSYGKAPYFMHAYTLIQEVIFSSENKISSKIVNSLKVISAYLDINTDIVETSTIYNNSFLKGQTRILDICEKEKADCYINPIGGQELYSQELFDKSGIKLKFINSKLLPYKQYNKEFVPWLSIIDVMMFNSSEKIREMLNSFELV